MKTGCQPSCLFLQVESLPVVDGHGGHHVGVSGWLIVRSVNRARVIPQERTFVFPTMLKECLLCYRHGVIPLTEKFRTSFSDMGRNLKSNKNVLV